MSNDIQRPHGMSQLDYLWVNFGGYKVSNEASSIPQEDVILTEQALTDLIQKSTSGGITALTFREHPTKTDTMELIGTSINGSVLTVVEMPKEVHVQSFSHRTVTQTDIDNGVPYPINSEVLSIVLTNGTEYLVSLEELNLVIRGGDTDTISTNVTNGVVNSHLKIDAGNNSISVVEIKSNSNGIYSNLKISQKSTGLELTKEEDGLSGRIPLGTTGYSIKFDQMTLSQYQALETKDPSTLYFITDKPYIYLGGTRYGVDMNPGEVPIVSLVYDADHMLLSYKKADGSDIQQIHMGPADENTPGMMSTETYIELQELKKALDGIVNVKEYIAEEVSKAAFSIEFGDESNGTKPLNLKNGKGDIISSVNIDVESYLEFGVSKIADAQDVEDSGGAVQEGHQILVLTLTSGNKIYVDLNQLVDVYTGLNTKSITLSVSNNQISADLNISKDDQILYIYNDGVRAHFQIVRQPGKILFYGKTQTDTDKLAEIQLADTVITTAFIEKATEETYTKYPPRYIDSKPYDQLTNPIVLGTPYFIIVFGSDTGDSSTSYQYNDYISINPILNTLVLSPNEGNIITRDENGYLYGSINWIEV